MTTSGKVLGICISKVKGIAKTPIESARVIAEFGLEGDAHAGSGQRQVSILSNEIVTELCDPGIESGPGAFGENLRTIGVELESVPIGRVLQVGDVQLEVTQIGKRSPEGTLLYDPLGMRIGPTKVVFCRVIKGGEIRAGDSVVTR